MVELYKARRAFDAHQVYQVWLKLVQQEELYAAMLRGEHRAHALAHGFETVELEILEDFAIQPGTQWHVENLRFRAVTMVSRIISWHLPATVRLVTDGNQGWLRDLVYEYLSLNRWVEYGHHQRFAECTRFAEFIQTRVLKRRHPPMHVVSVLAFELAMIDLLRRAASMPIEEWPAKAIATSSDVLGLGPVHAMLSLPVDLLDWLRAPTRALEIASTEPIEVLGYVSSAAEDPQLVRLDAATKPLFEAASTPRTRTELQRAAPGVADAMIDDWLGRGILCVLR